MLTLEQTTLYTNLAMGFIAEKPLSGSQDLRTYLAGQIGGDDAWRYATDIVVQDFILLAQRKAFAAADQAQRDAVEAQVLADWQARMDTPHEAAPVIPTTVTPVAPKTYGEHIDAIRAAYGEDANLQAACRYALLNGLTPDQVANAVGRHHTECHNLMYPG